MSKTVRIAIINCPGEWDYGQVFQEFFKNNKHRWPHQTIELEVFQAAKDDLNSALFSPENASRFVAYLITGSAASAYDDEEWIRRLETAIVRLHAKRSKIVGICFGHQVISHALSGAVERNPAGWGFGCRTFFLKKEASEYLENLRRNIRDVTNESVQDTIHILYCHQDHVPVLPAGLKSMGGTTHCPILGAWNGDNILTYQGHPEFSKEMWLYTYDAIKKLDLIQQRLPIGETEETILESVNQPCNDAWIADTIIGFVLQD